MNVSTRLLAGLALVVGLLTGCGGSPDLRITAQFHDAAGLFEGNDVGVLGVRVGQVESITPRGDHVDVVLSIDPTVKIPADAGAVVVSRSVATDRYVEMTPVYSSGPTMADGSVLTEAKTRTPVEFDELLTSLRDLSANLGGDNSQPLNRALTATAKALDGNGQRIGTALADLATTLDAANASSDDFASTVRNLDRFVGVLAANDRLARTFTEEVAEATELLDDEHGNIEKTLDALATMLRRVTAFVRAHRDEINQQIPDIQRIVRALTGKQGDFAKLLETMPLMLQNGQRAVTANGHLNFLTRPTEFLPTEAAFQMLCAHFPPGTCDLLAPGATTLFDLLRALAGVQ